MLHARFVAGRARATDDSSGLKLNLKVKTCFFKTTPHPHVIQTFHNQRHDSRYDKYIRAVTRFSAQWTVEPADKGLKLLCMKFRSRIEGYIRQIPLRVSLSLCFLPVRMFFLG